MPDSALVDSDFALDDYLRLGTHCCYVPGVGELMRETLNLKATAIWCVPAHDGDACLYQWSRIIALNPRLFVRAEWLRLKIAWAHEIGHLVVGRSHARATRYQLAHWDFNSLDS